MEDAIDIAPRNSQPKGSSSTMPPPNAEIWRQKPTMAEPIKSPMLDVRAQSIIPPWEFYGGGTAQPPPSPEVRTPLSVNRNQQKLDVDTKGTFRHSWTPQEIKVTDAANLEQSEPLSESEDDGNERNRLRRSPPRPFRASPLYAVSRNEKIRRHRSLPARTIRQESCSINGRAKDTLNNKKDFESLVDERVRRLLADQAIATVEARAPAQAQPQQSKRQRMSTAERMLRYPPLSKNVPVHLRKSDADLIKVAKLITPYERHRRAPYAFRYKGRLYAEYKHLRVAVGDNGQPVLTAQELSRL